MPRHERLYRCLLLLLPPRTRQDAQDELLETFGQEYRRLSARGRVARAAFWGRMTADVIVTAAAEHRDRFRHWCARDPRSSLPRQRMTQIPRALGHTLNDSRLAVRRFAKMPGWAIASAGTLAIGLAASIVTGVLVRDLLWRPLPLLDPERLVRINEISENGGRWWPSFPNAADWREHARVFDGVGIADVPAVKPVLLEGQR